MRILTVDVGTGTQDVLLFDSECAIENCCKLILAEHFSTLAEPVALRLGPSSLGSTSTVSAYA